LADPDAELAYRAICRLSRNPVSVTAFLKDHLKPVESPSSDRVAHLLLQLNSDDFTTRDSATHELAGLRELAVPALREALDAHPSLDLSRRLNALLEKAQRWVTNDPRRRQTLRAIEVLERIGSPDAVLMLEKIAAGASNSRITQSAKDSLVRLSARPATTSAPTH